MNSRAAWITTLASVTAMLVPRVAYAQSKEYLYIENSVGGDVTVISIPEHEIVSTIPATVIGHDPDDVIASSDGRVLFVNRGGAEDVLAISTATEEVLWQVSVGGTPNHLTLSNDDRYLYVPLLNSTFVEVVDTEKRAVVDRIPVGYGPHTTLLSPDGKRVYVGNILSDRIVVFEVGTHRVVKGIPMPEGVRPFQVSPDETRLWAQVSKLHGFVEVDLATDRVTKTIHLPTLDRAISPSAHDWPATIGHGMQLTPDGQYLFVAATLYDFVAIYSVPQLDLLATVPTGKEPGWLAVNHDGRFVYATNRADNTLSIISVAERREIRRLPVGNFPQRMKAVMVPRRTVGSR